MPKTLTIPVEVTVNGVKFPVGSTPNVADVQATDIVGIVSRYNDSLAFVRVKGRGTFTDATAV